MHRFSSSFPQYFSSAYTGEIVVSPEVRDAIVGIAIAGKTGMEVITADAAPTDFDAAVEACSAKCLTPTTVSSAIRPTCNVTSVSKQSKNVKRAHNLVSKSYQTVVLSDSNHPTGVCVASAGTL